MNLFVPDPRIELSPSAACQLQKLTPVGRSLVRVILGLIADDVEGNRPLTQFETGFPADFPGADRIKFSERYGLRIIFAPKDKTVRIISIEFGSEPPTEPRRLRLPLSVQTEEMPYISFTALRYQSENAEPKFVTTMSLCRHAITAGDALLRADPFDAARGYMELGNPYAGLWLKCQRAVTQSLFIWTEFPETILGNEINGSEQGIEIGYEERSPLTA